MPSGCQGRSILPATDGGGCFAGALDWGVQVAVLLGLWPWGPAWQWQFKDARNSGCCWYDWYDFVLVYYMVYSFCFMNVHVFCRIICHRLSQTCGVRIQFLQAQYREKKLKEESERKAPLRGWFWYRNRTGTSIGVELLRKKMGQKIDAPETQVDTPLKTNIFAPENGWLEY